MDTSKFRNISLGRRLIDDMISKELLPKKTLDVPWKFGGWLESSRPDFVMYEHTQVPVKVNHLLEELTSTTIKTFMVRGERFFIKTKKFKIVYQIYVGLNASETKVLWWWGGIVERMKVSK